MSVPNQKKVLVHKEPTNKDKKENYYAAINLNAMSAAAINLDAGAFKLWCYFAKNQDNYHFDLSSKAVAETFGIKIKQYNNAVAELISKGYLVITKGNNYDFYEIPVITKEDNAVITKSNKSVITFEDNTLLPKEIRNNTENTFNNTENNTENKKLPEAEEKPEAAEGSNMNPIIVSKEWLIERHNYIQQCANGLFYYNNKFYRIGDV